MAKVSFTAKRVREFTCPADKRQAFLWDTTAPGLGLRVTPTGKPAYVFQSLYQGKTLRITIGSPDAWSITDAQAKARELRSEEHTSELQSRPHLVCRLLLEKKKQKKK